MRNLTTRFHRLRAAATTRLLTGPRRDDRGELNSSVAWTGGMVLLAVTLVGIITAAATGFAESIDFGP
jgi:hypothetical protein